MRIILGERPNEKQKAFFLARARHIAYGGARGGGKSWAMRTKFVLLAARYPELKLLLLRRTLPELRENHILPLQALLAGAAVYRATSHEFLFPNGSRIRCGYCDLEQDVYRYQGQEFDIVGLEEATLFTEAQKDFITTCNRSVRHDISPRMYYTCNPGGVGHAWVKRLFIDRDYRNGERAEDHVFIPASVYDNPVLLRGDPAYIRTLQALPEPLRRAHLEGDWDVLSGQFFSEWRRELHTVEPFRIPGHWMRYRAIDYGLDRLACLWGAFDEAGNCYIYRELCESNLTVSEAAKRILAASGTENITATFMPKDMQGRSSDTGRTRYDVFLENGLLGTAVSNSRVDGWLNLAEWLHPVDNGTGKKMPRLRIFSSCRELIKCLPLLMHADNGDPNDVSTEPHEITHAPDALRYLLDGRPKQARAPEIYREPLPFERRAGEEEQNFLRWEGI